MHVSPNTTIWRRVLKLCIVIWSGTSPSFASILAYLGRQPAVPIISFVIYQRATEPTKEWVSCGNSIERWHLLRLFLFTSTLSVACDTRVTARDTLALLDFNAVVNVFSCIWNCSNLKNCPRFILFVVHCCLSILCDLLFFQHCAYTRSHQIEVTLSTICSKMLYVQSPNFGHQQSVDVYNFGSICQIIFCVFHPHTTTELTCPSMWVWLLCVCIVFVIGNMANGHWPSITTNCRINASDVRRQFASMLRDRINRTTNQ